MFRIQVSDPGLVHDLVDFFGRAECIVLQAGRDVIEVHVPCARSGERARRDVHGLVATWLTMNPGIEAELTS